MTTAHMNAPADVAGLVPDAGGASNEAVTRAAVAAIEQRLREKAARTAPVSTSLPPGNGRSRWAGVGMIPATVVAAILLGLTLRAVVPDLRYEIALVGLVVLLVGSAAGLLLGRRG